MPSVPPPDKLLSMEELPERCLTDPRLPKTYRNKIATTKFTPWPIEIRFCELTTSTNQTKSPPSLNFWFRAKGKLSDDQALHRCVVAFASDLIFLQVALNPHRKQGMKASSVSIDHAMWFHRPVIADDWILYVIFSPSAYNARGTVTGQMFNQKREWRGCIQKNKIWSNSCSAIYYFCLWGPALIPQMKRLMCGLLMMMLQSNSSRGRRLTVCFQSPSFWMNFSWNFTMLQVDMLANITVSCSIAR
nr:acyl-coenzyme A thioesterase 8 isoform X2 [Arachis hypogaea]